MREMVLITLSIPKEKREQYHRAAALAGTTVTSLCIAALERLCKKFPTLEAKSHNISTTVPEAD